MGKAALNELRFKGGAVMAGEYLAKKFKELENQLADSSDLIYGRVTGTHPLSIQVEGRFTIGAEHLTLSTTVKELTVSFNLNDYSADNMNINNVPVSDGKVDVDADVDSVSVTTGISANQRTITLQIFRDLQVGDQVSMIKSRKGQMYYVLDRR